MVIVTKEMANQECYIAKEMQNTRETDIPIEITLEHIESGETREDKKKFDERNEVSVVVIPMATQPIVVEKT
jgi:hypothetical protein